MGAKRPLDVSAVLGGDVVGQRRLDVQCKRTRVIREDLPVFV